MSTTLALFERWKALKGIESDRQALKALGLSAGAAVHWKAGRNGDAALIERLCKDLGENAMAMTALAMKEQSQGEAAKTWARFARQLGAAATLACVLLTALPAQSAPYGQAEQNQPIYIMRSVRRWLRNAFTAFRQWNSTHGCPYQAALLA